DRLDEPSADSPADDLSQGEGQQRIPAPTGVPPPKEESGLDSVLSASDEDIPPAPPGTVIPPNLNILELYRQDHRKLKTDKKKAGERRRTQERDEKGQFDGEYRFRKGWLFRRVTIPREKLEAAINNDVKLKHLQAQLEIPSVDEIKITRGLIHKNKIEPLQEQ